VLHSTAQENKMPEVTVTQNGFILNMPQISYCICHTYMGNISTAIVT